MQDTGTEKPAALVIAAYLQVAGTELEHTLQNLHNPAEITATNEWAEQLASSDLRLPCRIDARIVLIQSDLQVGECLVVRLA